MQIWRVILTIFLIQALVLLGLVHCISGTHTFSASWNPRAATGSDESQHYLQSIREAGTVLLGSRSQPKLTDIESPVFSLKMESPMRSVPGPPLGKEGQPRIYTFGISLQNQIHPEQRFRARYVFIRLWLLELLLLTVLVGIWAIPSFVGPRMGTRLLAKLPFVGRTHR